MEDLRDIAYMLNRYQAREIHFITNPNSKGRDTDDRYWEYYLGLREGRWKTEEEVAIHFGMEYPSKLYNRFRNELKDRLLDTLLFVQIGVPGMNQYTMALQEVSKLFVQTQTLFRAGGGDIFVETGLKCLKLALQVEELSTAIEVARLLSSYILVRPQLHHYREYISSIITKYTPALMAEINLQQAYEQFTLQFANEKGFKAKYAGEAFFIAEDFAKVAKKYPYKNIQIYYYTLLVYSKTLCHDWFGGLEAAEEAIAILKRKKYLIYSGMTMFMLQKMACLTMLERFEEARLTALETADLIPNGSSKWFKCYQLYVVNALYAERYAEAWSLVQMIQKHERFKTISEVDQESWHLYFGYLCLLIVRNRLLLTYDEKPRPFNLQRWLNDFKWLIADKQGSNLPVQILQIHVLLIEKRYDELDNRVEALRKYWQRNLDKYNEHFRTVQMLKLLEILVKYRHDPPTMHAAAAPYIERLSNSSNDILDRTFEIEVVPYERQWQWILEELQEHYVLEEEQLLFY